jgi:hypothetical protein
MGLYLDMAIGGRRRRAHRAVTRATRRARVSSAQRLAGEGMSCTCTDASCKLPSCRLVAEFQLHRMYWMRRIRVHHTVPTDLEFWALGSKLKTK